MLNSALTGTLLAELRDVGSSADGHFFPRFGGRPVNRPRTGNISERMIEGFPIGGRGCCCGPLNGAGKEMVARFSVVFSMGKEAQNEEVLVALAIAALVIATPSLARADTVWGQRFQDQPSDWGYSNANYTLTRIELRWQSGNQFSGVNPFAFSAPGWSSSGGATWGSASGPGVNLLQFNINFSTPNGGTQETSFDYFVYLMDRSGQGNLDGDERVLQRRLGHQPRCWFSGSAATHFGSRAAVDAALWRGAGWPGSRRPSAPGPVAASRPSSSCCLAPGQVLREASRAAAPYGGRRLSSCAQSTTGTTTPISPLSLICAHIVCGCLTCQRTVQRDQALQVDISLPIS